MKMPKKLKDYKLSLSGFYFGDEQNIDLMPFKYLVDHFESCISGDLTEELIEDPAIGIEKALERVKYRYNPTVYAVYEVVSYDMIPTKEFINRCVEGAKKLQEEYIEDDLGLYAKLYEKFNGADPKDLEGDNR